MAAVNIVLHEPVIPQNTGSIARLAACTGVALHLVHPLGFKVDAAAVKRAGLDYWPHVGVQEHVSWNAFIKSESPSHLFFFSKSATRTHWEAIYPLPCYLVFGSETKGLPPFLFKQFPDRFFKVPMRTHLVRSLNLAQCAAIVTYEVLRDHQVT